MEHTFQLTVRSFECDSYAHVNNAVYLHYLEAARMEFLSDIGFDYDKMRKMGFAIYIARINIAYKAPAFTNDILHIKTVPIKRRKTNGIFHQTVLKEEDVVAEAEVTWVFVNESGVPSRIPPELDYSEFNPD
jgi:YbgC/YbaW family acyl-CoA thioester hydrolase